MTKPIDLEGIKERLHRCDVRELEDYIYFLCDEIDRLRSVNYYNESAIAGARSLLAPIPGDDVEKQPPQGKTVRVRIPCIVGTKGGWMGGGTSKGLLSFLTDQTPEDQAASMLDGFERDTGDKGVIRWLTADLPVPEEVEVVAGVEVEK